MLARRITLVLRVGASVFLLTSISLVAIPDIFLELLNLGADPNSSELWLIRMLGVALIGLSAFMLMGAGNFGERALRQAGLLMITLSSAFTGFTAFAPGSVNIAKIIYLAIGGAFTLAYLWALRGYRSLR
ncbi:MAG: hypothetical protein FJW51_00060 [Actinobacteria bacterium]|nr:hypothetical protein [Actinomycetota bacterium]